MTLSDFGSPSDFRSRTLGDGVATRGPLPHLILTATGEDVRRCIACWGCDALVNPDMDLTIGELMQAAARDDERALDSATLWACAAPKDGLRCQQGIHVSAVLDELRTEAVRRGRTLPAPAGTDR
jgi:heterodisulfide reductase subunit C